MWVFGWCCPHFSVAKIARRLVLGIPGCSETWRSLFLAVCLPFQRFKTFERVNVQRRTGE